MLVNNSLEYFKNYKLDSKEKERKMFKEAFRSPVAKISNQSFDRF